MGGSQNLRGTTAAEQSVTGFEKCSDGIVQLDGPLPG